jgi:hypothetical protein
MVEVTVGSMSEQIEVTMPPGPQDSMVQSSPSSSGSGPG